MSTVEKFCSFLVVVAMVVVVSFVYWALLNSIK